MTTVKNIYDYINSIAPYETQEEWDNSGHLVGDFRQEVKKVVMALDATKEVCTFAGDIGADLVLTHHPVIFGGITNVKSDSAVYILANKGISHLCAHTNFDKAVAGINDNLAEILGLSNTVRLDDSITVVGELDCEMSMDDFAELVSDRLCVSGIRYTDTDKMIKKVSVCGGAGGDFIRSACENSDCYVTGDLKYHEFLDAQQEGFAVISAGHFETENKPFLMLKDRLKKIFTDVEFIIAPTENPVLSV
ncbi:MAG: Nif3-like dinuclear metal center hexameric protein [Eubacterium sp.]